MENDMHRVQDLVFTYIDGLAEGVTANFNNFLASIDTEFKQISQQFKSYRSTWIKEFKNVAEKLKKPYDIDNISWPVVVTTEHLQQPGLLSLSPSTTATKITPAVRARLINLCLPYGTKSAQLTTNNLWSVGDYHIAQDFLKYRSEQWELAEYSAPISDVDFLSLSFIMEVPLDRRKFFLPVDDNVFKRIRRAVAKNEYCKALNANIIQWNHTLSVAYNKHKYDESEYEDEEEKEVNHDDIGEVDDVERLLLSYKLQAMQNKSKQEKLFLNIADRCYARFDTWVPTPLSEESFIDQHLIMFLENIFESPSIKSIRSNGKLSEEIDNAAATFAANSSNKSRGLSSSDTSASTNPASLVKTEPTDPHPTVITGIKRKLSLDRMQPNYLAYYDGDVAVNLLAVEVKRPGCSGSQVIGDRSKCGVELKRIIDNQITFGVKRPMSFGVVVEGYTCHTFYCDLKYEAVYRYVELASFHLLKDPSDAFSIVTIMEHFLQIKGLMDQVVVQIEEILDSRSTRSSSSITAPPIQIEAGATLSSYRRPSIDIPIRKAAPATGKPTPTTIEN